MHGEVEWSESPAKPRPGAGAVSSCRCRLEGPGRLKSVFSSSGCRRQTQRHSIPRMTFALGASLIPCRCSLVDDVASSSRCFVEGSAREAVWMECVPGAGGLGGVSAQD